MACLAALRGGNGIVNLTAASTGAYAGIVIFQSRDNARAISLSGNVASSSDSGLIYAPNALLTISGNAQLQGTLVVDQLQLSGNGSSSLSADGIAAPGSTLAGELLAGDICLWVNDPTTYLTTEELARLWDSVTGLNILLMPYGVSIIEVAECDSNIANLVIDIATTTAVGGLTDGVLGLLHDGRSDHFGAGVELVRRGRSGRDCAGQYDFETIVTHELGHALGLGHNPDPTSAMNATLASSVVRRVLTAADLNIGHADYVPEALRVAMPHAGEVDSVLLTVWSNQAARANDKAGIAASNVSLPDRFPVEGDAAFSVSLVDRKGPSARAHDLVLQSLAMEKGPGVTFSGHRRIDGIAMSTTRTTGIGANWTESGSSRNASDEMLELELLNEDLFEVLSLSN